MAITDGTNVWIGGVLQKETEGEMRFGKEGYKKINKQMNRSLLKYFLCVALPGALLMASMIYLIVFGTPIK